MTGFVVMNFAYTLNDSPSSPASNCKFPIRWTSKNDIKNKPVRLMINFFPKEEVRKLIIHFIVLFDFSDLNSFVVVRAK